MSGKSLDVDTAAVPGLASPMASPDPPGAGGKTAKYDELYKIRYKLEHNQISRSEVDKLLVFETLNSHLADEDSEIQHTALQLVQEILPHLGPDTDSCMGVVTPRLVPCLGHRWIMLRKTTVHVLQIYLKFSNDVQSVLRYIVQYGLEAQDRSIVHETLVSIPILFPPDFDSRWGILGSY